MRVVVQRVDKAEVVINQGESRSIGKGLLILVGIESSDTVDDAEWLATKISQLRIFDDAHGVMNLSAVELGLEAMIISQFTLHAKTKKGNRPSYIHAAPPDIAIPLYLHFVELLQQKLEKKVVTGEFGAHMSVSLTNNGPVTLTIDTKNKE